MSTSFSGGSVMEEGYGVYQALSWLLRWLDGYRGGSVPPLPLPQRKLNASPTTADELDEATVTQPSLLQLPEQRFVSPEPWTPRRTSTGG